MSTTCNANCRFRISKISHYLCHFYHNAFHSLLLIPYFFSHDSHLLSLFQERSNHKIPGVGLNTATRICRLRHTSPPDRHSDIVVFQPLESFCPSSIFLAFRTFEHSVHHPSSPFFITHLQVCLLPSSSSSPSPSSPTIYQVLNSSILTSLIATDDSLVINNAPPPKNSPPNTLFTHLSSPIFP